VRSPALLGSLLGISMALSACYAYRPVAVAPSGGSRVRVVLAGAASVTTMVPGREDTRRAIPGVLEANGRIQAAAGDTLALRLGELWTAAGAVPDVADQVALLPTAQIARIEERRFQAGTTLLAGAGVSLIALSTYIVLLTVALVRGI
jgi:hypothetical protein